jgi:hypothetical protein
MTQNHTPRTPPLDGLIITILGGTGEQGRGLARRFAMAGHPVIIGSRSYDRARAIAQEVGHGICGLANRDAIREADLVIVTVPYEGHSELLVGLAAELAGKIVVDCVNPLGFDQGGAYPLPVPASRTQLTLSAKVFRGAVTAPPGAALPVICRLLLQASGIDAADAHGPACTPRWTAGPRRASTASSGQAAALTCGRRGRHGAGPGRGLRQSRSRRAAAGLRGSAPAGSGGRRG